MLELLFLLLPIAAAYGWYMGYRSVQQNRQQELDRFSKDYVTGVNFLLSNQPDKAEDLFLDILKADSNAFEAHVTLGNLYRTRGEIEGAIRIHQSLIESAEISFEQRLLATQQLGRDYMVAGLYDRAEDIFQQLVDEKDFSAAALQQLLLLYQATSDWQNAIDVATKLVKLGQHEQRFKIAHFYCELAMQGIENGEHSKAKTLLKKAAVIDKKCARVSLMMGELHMQAGEYRQAIQVLEHILTQDKYLIGEALPLLKICYQKTKTAHAEEQFIKKSVALEAGVEVDLIMADFIEQNEGIEAAQAYIYRRLQRFPTLQGFHRLIDYQLSEAEDGRAKESLQLLRHMVGEQIRNDPRYRCCKCGFTAHSLYWHCPSCRSWDTIKPIQGLDDH